MSLRALVPALLLAGCYAATTEPVELQDPCVELTRSECDEVPGCGFVCDFGCVSHGRLCGREGDPRCGEGQYCQRVRIDPCLDVARLTVQGVCVPDVPPPPGRTRCDLGEAGEGWACAPGAEYCCQALDLCMAYPAEFGLCPRPN